MFSVRFYYGDLLGIYLFDESCCEGCPVHLNLAFLKKEKKSHFLFI